MEKNKKTIDQLFLEVNSKILGTNFTCLSEIWFTKKDLDLYLTKVIGLLTKNTKNVKTDETPPGINPDYYYAPPINRKPF